MAVAWVREAGVKEAGVVAKMRVVGVVNWVEIAVRMQVGMGEVVGAGAVGVMWVGVRVAVVAVGVVAVGVAGVDARGSARGDRIHLGSYQDALRSCIRPGAIQIKIRFKSKFKLLAGPRPRARCNFKLNYGELKRLKSTRLRS